MPATRRLRRRGRPEAAAQRRSLGRTTLAIYPPLADTPRVRFVETRVFTEAVADLLSDDEYSTLQRALIYRPDLGVVIPGGGGIRKVRWRAAGRGKRSGIRVIYFWQVNPER